MSDGIKTNKVIFVLDIDDHWDHVQKWSAIDSLETWHGSVSVNGKEGSERTFAAIVCDPQYRRIKADSFDDAKRIVCEKAGVVEVDDA